MCRSRQFRAARGCVPAPLNNQLFPSRDTNAFLAILFDIISSQSNYTATGHYREQARGCGVSVARGEALRPTLRLHILVSSVFHLSRDDLFCSTNSLPSLKVQRRLKFVITRWVCFTVSRFTTLRLGLRRRSLLSGNFYTFCPSWHAFFRRAPKLLAEVLEKKCNKRSFFSRDMYSLLSVGIPRIGASLPFQ